MPQSDFRKPVKQNYTIHCLIVKSKLKSKLGLVSNSVHLSNVCYTGYVKPVSSDILA